MKKILKSLLVSSIFGLSPMVIASEVNIHWGYDKDSAPEHWGSLSEQFKICNTGKNQSPINITNAFSVVEKKNIDISYTIAPQDIVFNGHTVQVNSKNMDDYIVLDQKKFILKQFHFHTPSENQINGITYPMEIHFVHVDEQGDLAVLAVMFELGQSNNEITKLWKSISKKENDVKEIKRIVNLEKLLPEVREYYRFTGSLTTPPCDEGVNWIVLKKPLQISQEQIDTFKNILKQPSNNRPIQQTNGRIIIE